MTIISQPDTPQTYTCDELRRYGLLQRRNTLLEVIRILEAPLCGHQGFAGPTCCVLPKGHTILHSYGTPMMLEKVRVDSIKILLKEIPR